MNQRGLRHGLKPPRFELVTRITKEALNVTIKEIANSMGVSTATVSNVIHGHLEKMSPETAQMIRKKLEE